MEQKKKMSESAPKTKPEGFGARESAACMGKNNPYWVPREVRICGCGCGGTFECLVTSKQKYLFQHHMLSEDARHKQSTKMKKDNPMKRPEIAARIKGGGNPTKRPEVRKKISESKIGKVSGDKNPNWHGGIGNFPYPFEFNNELTECVRVRYNHTCVGCKRKQDQLKRN